MINPGLGKYIQGPVSISTLLIQPVSFFYPSEGASLP